MFHPMVAGVTIPGMGLFGLILAALHRPQPEQQARGPQVRDLAVHDLPHVLGRARHHRLVLPGPGLQLHLPVARRAVLRPVRSSRTHELPPPSSPSSSPSLVVLAAVRAPRHGRAARDDRPTPSASLVPRDPQARPQREPRRAVATEPAPATGREVERAAALERRGRRPRSSRPSARAGRRGSRPTPRRSASPAASSSTAASSP